MDIDIDTLMQEVRAEVARLSQIEPQANFLRTDSRDLQALVNSLHQAKELKEIELGLRHGEAHLANLPQAIEADLAHLSQEAEFHTQAFAKWPDNLQIFPFRNNRKLQSFFLKPYHFLFKKQTILNSIFIHVHSIFTIFFREQRHFDLTLMDAQRESLLMHQRSNQAFRELAASAEYTQQRCDQLYTEVEKINEKLTQILEILHAR